MGGVVFDCPVKFGLLRIGSRSARIVDSKYERTIVYNEGRIVINGYTWIGIGCRINVYTGAELNIGKNFKVTGRTTIICRKNIVIGADCLFSWDIQIMDTDFHQIYDEQGNMVNGNNPIEIGNHVWIGARSTILKGSNIPSNCIVAAGSVFSGRRTEENCIYGGVGRMLTVIKKNVRWSDF